MNEKIKELALQAGEYVNSVYTPPVRSKTPGKIWEDGHVDWMEQFNEKFAQLIVQECANACLSATKEGSSMHLVSVAYADAVKKHFGV
jgi:hypothetical protein